MSRQLGWVLHLPPATYASGRARKSAKSLLLPRRAMWLTVAPAMTSPLPDLLQANFVKLDLVTKEKPEAIHEVASLLTNGGRVRDFPGFFHALLARDELSSTAVGEGIAFPHARTDCVSEIAVAIGRSQSGILFGESLVKLIFVIGTPSSKIKEYLLVVGALARILKSEAVRDRLLHATTEQEFIDSLAP